MTLPDWIVCERTGRWAAALRTTGTRQATHRKPPFRIVEVRSLSELEPLALARILDRLQFRSAEFLGRSGKCPRLLSCTGAQ